MNTMKEEFLDIENVEISTSLHERFALACDYRDARYHVWIDRKTLTMEPIIYKNPARDLKADHPDYFRTRKLKPGSDFMARLVSSMFHALKSQDLIAKYKAKEAKQEIDRIAAANEEYRLECIRNAGPDLLKALDAAAHECANATAGDLERLKDLAQGWAKLIAKCKGD